MGGDMTYDKNQCKFSGTVEAIKPINTKTGTPMVSFKLKCWKEYIKGVAFKDLAEKVIATVKQGDRIEIAGKIESRNYEYEDRKYNSFQIVADEVEKIATKKPPQLEHGQREVATFDVGEPFLHLHKLVGRPPSSMAMKEKVKKHRQSSLPISSA